MFCENRNKSFCVVEAGNAISQLCASQATKKCVGGSNQVCCCASSETSREWEINSNALLSTLSVINHVNEFVLSDVCKLGQK